MPSAVEISSYLGLIAVGLLGANLLVGLLMAAGYNPVRHWPKQPVKLFTLHNWTAYVALGATALHPTVLLWSKQPPFSLYDVLVPVSSPVQPTSNTLGAIALYLVVVVVVTSYFRSSLGRRRWKAIHYTTYAAATIFFIHGIIADPTVSGRAVDYIDGEKVYIEGCAVLFLGTAAWRIRNRRTRRRLA